MTSPRLRAAFHRALDIVLDALDEEQAEVRTAPRRKRQVRAVLTSPTPKPVLAPEVQARVDAVSRRLGLTG